VDGKVGRTKKRSETWNATANQWNFPQTPARVQLSIWPGGADTNAPGTISWAGGPIDWDAPDIQNYGYYFATFGQVEVECYNASSGPGTNKHISYTIKDAKATNDTVVDGDKKTVLKSFAGTGLDMDAGGSSASASDGASGTQTASGPVASVPGGTAGGPGSAPGQAGDGTSGGDSSSSSGGAPACQATGFSQDCGGGSSNTGSGKSGGIRAVGERTLGASAFAGLIAVAGLLWL
jgi:hypothetical protein